jgi:hypothetical protein
MVKVLWDMPWCKSFYSRERIDGEGDESRHGRWESVWQEYV